MSEILRSKLIRLAHQKPELRPTLLPLLRGKKALMVARNLNLKQELARAVTPEEILDIKQRWGETVLEDIRVRLLWAGAKVTGSEGFYAGTYEDYPLKLVVAGDFDSDTKDMSKDWFDVKWKWGQKTGGGKVLWGRFPNSQEMGQTILYAGTGTSFKTLGFLPLGAEHTASTGRTAGSNEQLLANFVINVLPNYQAARGVQMLIDRGFDPSFSKDLVHQGQGYAEGMSNLNEEDRLVRKLIRDLAHKHNVKLA